MKNSRIFCKKILALVALFYGVTATADDVGSDMSSNHQTQAKAYSQAQPTDSLASEVYLPDEPFSQDEPSQPIQLPAPSSFEDSWVEHKRNQTKHFLNRTAKRIDNWFGAEGDKKAYANLRVMTDFHHDKYNGERLKPKLRGRIYLPALENRLSIMIGADDLENSEHVGSYSQSEPFGERVFSREQSRDENASLALRFSKYKQSKNIDTDFDLGTRSGNELYVRLRAQKNADITLFGYDGIESRLEQIYRYGTKSEHYLRTNHELSYPLSQTRLLSGLNYLDYSHNDTEEIILGHTLRHTHQLPAALGKRTLSYGLHLENQLDEDIWANRYGPFIHYRQPLVKPWFFVQAEASFYNNKLLNQDHHLATFLRLEAVF